MANKELTFVAFIVDRSGSMDGLQNAVIEGFNAYMKEQRNAAGKAIMSLILFDDRYEVPFDKIDVQAMPDLTHEVFVPRGTTALFDSIGRTIINTEDWIASLPEEERPGKVLFIITTDGQENASTDFQHQKISDMIKFQREIQGWEFMFTSSNLETAAMASTLNIPKGNIMTMDNTGKGYVNTYMAVSAANVRYRSSNSANLTEDLLSSTDTTDTKTP